VAAASTGAGVNPEPLDPDLVRVRRAVLACLGVVAVLAPLALAVARWPRYWTWIAPEQTPMTWLQSVVLVLASAAALLLAVLLRLRRETSLALRPWQVLALGFAALAVDERFALHERVRDGVLAPRGIHVPFLPWVAPGDFLVMAIALAGLAVLPLVLPGLHGDRTARVLFMGGVGLAGIAVGTDSIDPATWSVQAERVQQSLEEVVELAAGLCLLGAVLMRLLAALSMHAATQRPTAESPQDLS
jgi:uncharacterized membrane protein YidH (DUF202 family)